MPSYLGFSNRCDELAQPDWRTYSEETFDGAAIDSKPSKLFLRAEVDAVTQGFQWISLQSSILPTVLSKDENCSVLPELWPFWKVYHKRMTSSSKPIQWPSSLKMSTYLKYWDMTMGYKSKSSVTCEKEVSWCQRLITDCRHDVGFHCSFPSMEHEELIKMITAFKVWNYVWLNSWLVLSTYNLTGRFPQPRRDLNPQSSDPKSDALSFRPRGSVYMVGCHQIFFRIKLQRIWRRMWKEVLHTNPRAWPVQGSNLWPWRY